MAAFGDEATKSVRPQLLQYVECDFITCLDVFYLSQVQLWDVSKTSKLQQLSMSSNAALDLLPFGSSHNLLAVLTENKLFTYKWQWR